MLLIDTQMLIRRCYAKMDFLKNQAGVPTGMEFGTLNSLQGLQNKFPDQQVVLCLDSMQSWRKDKHPEYKANRERITEGSYWMRLGAFQKFLKCVYYTAGKTKYEADDIMFTLSRTQEGPHYIYTNDKDLLQAINDNVKVLKSFASKLYLWDIAAVKEKYYSLKPEFLPEFRAFVGDGSDNLFGVPRIKKAFLAQLITWAHDNGISLHCMLGEIATAEWSENMRGDIITFIESGIFDRNYELMKLTTVPDIQIIEPISDDEYVAKKLKEWNIYSLKLSKKYNLCESEEF